MRKTIPLDDFMSFMNTLKEKVEKELYDGNSYKALAQLQVVTTVIKEVEELSKIKRRRNNADHSK